MASPQPYPRSTKFSDYVSSISSPQAPTRLASIAAAPPGCAGVHPTHSSSFDCASLTTQSSLTQSQYMVQRTASLSQVPSEQRPQAVAPGKLKSASCSVLLDVDSSPFACSAPVGSVPAAAELAPGREGAGVTALCDEPLAASANASSTAAGLVEVCSMYGIPADMPVYYSSGKGRARRASAEVRACGSYKDQQAAIRAFAPDKPSNTCTSPLPVIAAASPLAPSRGVLGRTSSVCALLPALAGPKFSTTFVREEPQQSSLARLGSVCFADLLSHSCAEPLSIIDDGMSSAPACVPKGATCSSPGPATKSTQQPLPLQPASTAAMSAAAGVKGSLDSQRAYVSKQKARSSSCCLEYCNPAQQEDAGSLGELLSVNWRSSIAKQQSDVLLKLPDCSKLTATSHPKRYSYAVYDG